VKRLAAACVALALAGCSLEPRYEQPPLPVSVSYPQGPAYPSSTRATGTPAADLGWSDLLQDARLRRLIDIALTNNRDLRVAMLNVQQARALYRIQDSALFPALDASAASNAGKPRTAARYTASVDLSWEIDLFGRVRSLDHQALQQYFATQSAQKAAHILLVSQVADQYMQLLADDELLAVTRSTLVTARKSYDLNQAQLGAGIGTELTVAQAQTVVEQAQANYAAQVRARAQTENALVLLLGEPMPADLPPPAPFGAQVVTDVPEGLPSDLLTRRPDVMQAEALLRGANAGIGAARAAFFPSISLTGSYGSVSSQLSGLFKGPAEAWSFVPSITMPIFHAGALRANLDAARIQKDINIAQYEKAIQVAFREVADGLAARGTYDDQTAALERLVAAQQKSLDLSQLRFKQGIDSYLSVLTAQTQLYDAQQQLVAARLARLTNRVDLYRALGGGWQATTSST